MKFSIAFIAVVSAGLSVFVHAAPAPVQCESGLCAQIYGRDAGDIMIDDLVERAKKSSGVNRAATAKSVQNVQKAQASRARQKQTKKAANAKTQQVAGASIKAKGAAFRNQAKKGVTPVRQINKQADKIKASEKGRVAAQSRMDHKYQKTQNWAAQKKNPAQKATSRAAAAARRQDRKKTGAPAPANAVSKKAPKPTKQQKHNVKQQFQAAKTKLQNTKGLPGRKDKITVGAHKTDGRAVRQGVFNTYLHKKNPVGSNPINKQPKTFKNTAYSSTHGDASLRGKRPLPQNAKEYPIINGSPNGWTGSGGVGPLRAATYKQGGQRRVAVLGHDTSRGGSADDHYVGKVTPAKKKRDLDWEFEEDFE